LPVIATSSFAPKGVSIHCPQANRFNPERSGWFQSGGHSPIKARSERVGNSSYSLGLKAC